MTDIIWKARPVFLTSILKVLWNLCHGHLCTPKHAMGPPAAVTIVATVYREKTFLRMGRIFLIILAMRGVGRVTYKEQRVRFAVVSMHGAVLNPAKEVMGREVNAALLWVVTALPKNATEGISIHTQVNYKSVFLVVKKTLVIIRNNNPF